MTGPSRFRTPRRGEHGVTLIEVLVAVVILAITVAGLTLAIVTSMRTSSEANLNARLDALVTAYGEAIKDLPFEQCATAAQYETSFASSDLWTVNNPDTAESVQLQLELDATLDIVSITPANVADGCRTNGTQSLTLKATGRGRDRTTVVAKRDPNAAFAPIVPNLTVEDRTPLNSLQNLFSVRVTVEPPEYNYVYRWWCDVGDTFEDISTDPGQPEPSFLDNVDCLYPSPTQGSPDEFRRIGIEVIGPQGVVRESVQVTLNKTSSGLLPPNVTIWTTSEPACSDFNQCRSGATVSFEALASAPSGSVIRWQWQVLDGSVPIDCFGSNCSTFTHEFQGGGTFGVLLTVWDNWGAEATSNAVTVIIDDPPRVKPTVVLTANTTVLLAQGPVTLNGGQSHGDGSPAGAGITSWNWNCGNGPDVVGASLLTHTCTYGLPGTYTARLFVVAANGTTNEAQIQIRVLPFAPPANFTHSANGKGDIWLIRNAYIDFTWTNPERAVGDQLTLEINIAGRTGICGIFGIGLDGRKFTVPMNAAFTGQSYRTPFSSSPRGFNGVCSTDTFTYQVRIARTNGGVTTYSSWSAPRDIDIDFF